MTEQEIRDDERRRIAEAIDEAAQDCRRKNPDEINPDKIECMEAIAAMLRTPRDALVQMGLVALVDEIRAEQESHA